ncbi:MAG: type 1 glutamine amidotransferase domain-containing protein [Symploca sp. SIO3E6]|nr:type 1 glutamine amidotransferase domain-containing protein [Caldora sp. SIO3E6]
MPKILIVATSHSQLGISNKPTGMWLEELTVPYYQFIDAGVSVIIASVKGGLIPIDPGSQKTLGENSPSVERFLKDPQAKRAIEESVAIEEIKPSEYDAIFLPGGHGTMWDLPQSDRLTQIIAQALKQNRVVAAVCHGPAGLISARTSDGRSILEGRKVTAFTNSEEEAVGLTNVVPFLLETKLRQLGADFQNANDFQAFAIADGNLITGQNPASSLLVAEKVLDALNILN